MAHTIPYQLLDFKSEVLDASQNTPVLVDYWASWCGPCMFLDPIIEKLSNEADGKWKLVKVDTEKHSELAAEWGIRSIPNLKLFYKGEVIAELAGAMEEAEMHHWITSKLPSKAQVLAMEASALIAKGDTLKGIELLEKAIELDSNCNEARILLAKLLVWKNPKRVPLLVNKIQHVEEAQELMILSNFIDLDENELEEGSSREELLTIKKLLLELNFERAIQLLIKAMLKNKMYHNELARKLAMAIFHTLGEGNEVTKSYRKVFDTALY